ncbi:MAG: LuxR C-terminal-related transcriptional regulator [Bacteroidetes bacterium]|nr:LuxR C-terminal-related transcriptional regulator [Bacteroidota bacterium]
MKTKNIPVYFRLLLSGILLVMVHFTVVAQINNIGTPFITNYSRNDFKAGQQSWMIDQAPDGRLYFANNDGLLEFDGINWELYPLPKRIIVRSIYTAPEGRIYVGGYNEFGFFEPDSLGHLTYQSYNSLLEPEDRNFDEIWRIHHTPDGIIFQSYKQIIIIKNGKANVIKAPGIFHFSYFVNGQLYVVDLEKGILRYSMGSFYPLIGTDLLIGKEIWAILPYANKLLFATADQGLFLYDGNQLQEWSNQASAYLKQNQVYSAIVFDDIHFAFGTISNGLLICTKEGRPVQKINRTTGLINNTILNLLKDNAGNLWLGTDNGIDYVEINSPLSILSYSYGLSAGYTSVLHNGILYLGTNQGVFYQSWDSFQSTDDDEFRFIKNVSDQVWTLKVIDNQLLCGTHSGTFIIDGSVARNISTIQGGWNYRQHPTHSNLMIGGTYSGMVLFEKQNGRWVQKQKINGFSESSRIFEIEEDGSIWMSHGFKGLYHIFLNTSMDSIVKVDFYEKNINVVQLKDKVFFVAPDGLYLYNSSTDSFDKAAFMNDVKSWKNLVSLKEDDEGNIWYFEGNETGVLRIQEDGAYTDINLPFRQLKGKLIGGFEFVYSIENDHVLFGASDGFIHYNPGISKNYQKSFNVYINKVSFINPDSLIYLGHHTESYAHTPHLDFRNNSFYFSFAANDFENPKGIVYATYLEGYDNGWTEFENRNTREFTNLWEGDYIFHVKARNIYGTETEPVSFSFSIDPPWQRSTFAILIYIVIGLILMGLTILLIKKKIDRSKLKEAKLQQEKFKEREDKLQRETLEAEKEIIRLRNEKLRQQMTMKDKELANATLEMIQKNKLLNKIKGDLKKITTSTHDAELKNQVQTLTKRINKELDTEKQWEVFETHFENVHEAFLKRLKTAYPELSPRELKLCAYLRMNISSKEIAALMNISTRGVEISRYRLRKKLQLSRNENLTEFILTF